MREFGAAVLTAREVLLGVGVAFKIYYIMAWREGQTNLLQTALTRAVFFSALTTATAFGSLWFSNHPGTASMGKLLALSLMSTLAAAVLFQPVLMGKPREEEVPSGKTANNKPGNGNGSSNGKSRVAKPVLPAKPSLPKPRAAKPRKILPDTRGLT